MAYRQSDLGLMVRLKPEQARRQVLGAVRAAGGEVDDAAAALGVTRRTLDRYVRILDLSSEVNALRPEGRKGKARRKKAA